MHSLIHEQYVRAEHAERVARRGWSGRRLWRHPPPPPPPPPPPRPPGRGGGIWASTVHSPQPTHPRNGRASAPWTVDCGLGPAQRLARQPGGTGLVQPLHLGAGEAGHVALHVEADRALRVGEVAVAGGEAPEQLLVELEVGRRVDRVEPVLLVDG